MIRKLINFYDKTLCTVFGVGYWPWGPGTAGSLVGCLLWTIWYYFFEEYFEKNLIIYYSVPAAAIIVVTLVSIPSINRLEWEWGPDPKRVVIDEVVGMWVSLIAVPPETLQLYYTPVWYYMIIAFLYFRLFDITKVFGIKYMEDIPGGWGVMLDDILAGVYSAIILTAVDLIVTLIV